MRAWFFVRYWEGGPHIRFRLLCPEGRSADDFVPDFVAGVATRMSGSGLSKADYYANHTFDGKAEDPALLPWFDEGSVEIIKYAPELQRYGGPAAIGASERLFHRSSEIAAGVIRQTRNAFEKRLAVACSFMAATVVSLTRDIEAIELIFAQYAVFWASYSEQNRQIAAGLKKDADISHVVMLERFLRDRTRLSQLGGLISVWYEGVTALVSDLDRVYARGELLSPFDAKQVRDPETYRAVSHNIMYFQLHMLNNRLGVVPAQELVLASALSAAAGTVRRHVFTCVKETAE